MTPLYARIGLPVVLLTFAACISLAPPISTAPSPAPSEQSAWVVFLLEDSTGLYTVRDESGEILGRLWGRSWFAVERPPGAQWFFAGDPTEGSQPSWQERGVSTVGVLSAHLDVGRVYLVRVAFRTGPRRRLAQVIRDWRNPDGCIMVTDSESSNAEFLDLIGIRPGGAQWNRALSVLREGVRYQPAPRGLEEDSEASEIPGQGRARLGHCLDVERSRLTRAEGSPFWPLTPADPSIEGIAPAARLEATPSGGE